MMGGILMASTSTAPALYSRYVDIDDHRMHYVESGKGDVILFLHGMPTSSYVWRGIMPDLANHAKCIAVDLIGMGLSSQPDIDYTIDDHASHIESFINQLGLKNVTLMMHGWGSVIGFDYASRHPENVKALAFYESHLRVADNWDQLSLPVQQLAAKLTRPEMAYRAIVEQNYLLKKILPGGAVDTLPDDVIEAYERPFQTADSRKVLWQYVQELPLGKAETPASKIIDRYSQWLVQTDIPKLMLYAVPGFITTLDTVQWAKKNLKQLTLSPLDDVLHFAQESIPELFSEKLKVWYKTQVQ
jgi:haloalkane dehalogenase